MILTHFSTLWALNWRKKCWFFRKNRALFLISTLLLVWKQNFREINSRKTQCGKLQWNTITIFTEKSTFFRQINVFPIVLLPVWTAIDAFLTPKVLPKSLVSRNISNPLSHKFSPQKHGSHSQKILHNLESCRSPTAL